MSQDKNDQQNLNAIPEVESLDKKAELNEKEEEMISGGQDRPSSSSFLAFFDLNQVEEPPQETATFEVIP